MNNMVLDSSVCMTWFTRTRLNDIDGGRSFELRKRLTRGEIGLVEPPNWRTDIADYLTRHHPAEAEEMVADLTRIVVTIDDSLHCLQDATEIAVKLGRRVSDTIYHATAMRRGIPFITANTGYYRAARSLGNITLLRDWPVRGRVRETPAVYAVHARRLPVRCLRKRRFHPRIRAIVGA